jgi:AbrB family looped-hinge helix DNA binding protein
MQIEFVASTRIDKKGQLTIPKQYRDELGLETGTLMSVLRAGDALILIPEENRFRLLCESIASVFARRQITAADLLDTLPKARQRVFARRNPEFAGQTRKVWWKTKRR